MKSVIKKDIIDIFYKRRKMIVITYLILIISILYSKYIIEDVDLLNINILLGIEFSFNVNIIYILNYFLLKSFSIYIVLYIFIKDTQCDYSFLITRLNKMKWLNSKIISCFLIIAILDLMKNFIINIFFMDFIFLNKYFITIFNSEIVGVASLIIYSSIISSNKFKKILMISTCIMMVILISIYQNLYIQIPIGISLIIVFILVYRKKIQQIFERSI